MKPVIHCTVGHIASGKSTYTKNAAKAGFIVVNDDSLTESLHGGDYGLYSADNKTIYKAVGMSILTHSIAAGKSVVVDTGSRNRRTRSRWVSIR
jgi:dephospho-CoA kinase